MLQCYCTAVWQQQYVCLYCCSAFAAVLLHVLWCCGVRCCLVLMTCSTSIAVLLSTVLRILAALLC